VVEGTTLEMWRRGNLTESSNLSLSADKGNAKGIVLSAEREYKKTAFLEFCSYMALSSNG